MLVDFKGGATFLGLDRLPHTAAVITNLADELPLVDRMVDAINGELVRRQELLRAAGNYASVADYEKARGAGAAGAAAGAADLVDEFSELLSQRPDFIDLFVQIGRVGRSLGVHLLLASQRLEEGRLRGLDTHLSYRIGLRTFSAMESRAVLGVPDAYELPRSPGTATSKSAPRRWSGSRPRTCPAPPLSEPPTSEPPSRTRPPPGGHLPAPRCPVPFTAAPVMAGPSWPRDAAAIRWHRASRTRGRRPCWTSMVAACSARPGKGPPAHQVWLPPLAEPPALDELLGAAVATGERGLGPANPGHGALQVPVGLVDKPFEQRRDLLCADLAGAAGHVAVVGGAADRQVHALRTLISHWRSPTRRTRSSSTARLRRRRAGRAGRPAARRRVADRLQPDGAPDRRRGRRAARRPGAAVPGRRDRLDGELPAAPGRAAGSTTSPYGDVFLVIDGWLTLRSEFEELETGLAALATRGLSYGVHVVVPRRAGWTSGRRCGTCSAPGWSCGSATRATRGRPARGATPCRRRPGRGLATDGAALPRRGATRWIGDRARPSKRGRRGRLDRPAGAGRAAAAALLPADALPQPGDRPAGSRRVPIGIAEARPARRSGSTSPPTRTSCCSATPSAARRPCCALVAAASPSGYPRSRRGSSWSTTGAACWRGARRRT